MSPTERLLKETEIRIQADLVHYTAILSRLPLSSTDPNILCTRGTFESLIRARILMLLRMERELAGW